MALFNKGYDSAIKVKKSELIVFHSNCVYFIMITDD